MDPMMIMAMISAAMPIIQQMLAMGLEIAKAVQATQTAHPDSPALPALHALQTAHANLVKSTVDSMAAGLTAAATSPK